jgi:hypothetical protein
VIAGLLQRNPAVRLTGAQAAAILGSPATSTMPVGPGSGYRPTSPLEQAAAPAGPRKRRWPWLVVALVVGLLAGAAGTYAVVNSLSEKPFPTLSYGPGGDVADFDVSQGYCYLVTPSPGHSVDSGASRDCDDLHEIEIIATLPPFGTSFEVPYPGVPALTDFAQGACRMYFATSVAGDDKAKLTMSVLVPSQQAFEKNSASPGSSSASYQSRDAYCVLRATDGSQLTGSRVIKQPS